MTPERAANQLRAAVAEMRGQTRMVRLFAAGAVAVEWAAWEHRETGVCSGCGPHGCSAVVSANTLLGWSIALLGPDEALGGPGERRNRHVRRPYPTRPPFARQR